MKSIESSSDKDLFLLHIIFSVLCVIILTALPTIAIGLRLLILVVIYNILVPLIGKWRNHSEWLGIWSFVFPLSILQVFPDWFLATQLNVIVFPDS
jgi:hypothetical protein